MLWGYWNDFVYSGCEFRVASFGLRVSGYEFRVISFLKNITYAILCYFKTVS